MASRSPSISANGPPKPCLAAARSLPGDNRTFSSSHFHRVVLQCAALDGGGKMKRMTRLVMILAIAAVTMFLGRPASAQDQDFSKVQIKVTKVSGNIYMLEGAGGNIAASVKIGNKPAAKAALPVITFEHDVTVHLNGEDIRAMHFPSGHTDGDSIIFFPKNNVVHMGDDFVRYGFPFVDVASGGSVQGIIDAMEKTAAQLPADVKVIPGHGALSNLDDVRAYTKMLKETSAVVQKALDGHKTLEQMKQEKILAPWEKFSGNFVNTDAFIETLDNSLTGHKGEFMKHN